MPPRPHWKLSASARIAEKHTTMPRRTRYEVIYVSFTYIRRAEQALRSEDQDHRDRAQRHSDAIVRRHHQGRELAHHADDERADEGAERASQAAEDGRGEDADQVVAAHRRLERPVHADQNTTHC